jgi:hypothetical protein
MNSATKQLKISEFIDQVLIDELCGLVDSNISPYLCFILLSIGIEFIGTFWESIKYKNTKIKYEQNDDRHKKRYIYAMELFPKRRGRQYVGKGADLYKYLRCGMAHVLLSDPIFRLTTQSESPTVEHLKKKGSITYLVLEPFTRDFVSACNKLINEFKEPKNKYLDKNVLEIPDVMFEISTLTPALSGGILGLEKFKSPNFLSDI